MADQDNTVNDWQVTLTIPCAAEYVGTARLTILGIAARLGLSYDQVEDVRLAVGEACTNAIERYRQRGESTGTPAPTITIRARHEPGRLVLEIEDSVSGISGTEAATSDVDAVDGQEIGALLMEILVDEFSVHRLSNGNTVVRLVKFTAEV